MTRDCDQFVKPLNIKTQANPYPDQHVTAWARGSSGFQTMEIGDIYTAAFAQGLI